MKSASIAAVCHAVNAAYCASIGDASQPAWADAPEWQKASAIAGVEFRLANADATPEDLHKSWMDMKLADGWKVGKKKDPEKKLHPCLVPYDKLPAEQRTKDYLFSAVVTALKDQADEAMPAPAATPAPAPVHNAAAIDKKFVAVKYIGRRDEYRDGTYGTGLLFIKGQTRMVPAEYAVLMLRHTDVYVPGEGAGVEAGQAAPTRKTDESDDPIQQARDSVAYMEKDALASYAKVHFRVDLDVDKKVGDLREEVTRLIDQFGLA